MSTPPKPWAVVPCEDGDYWWRWGTRDGVAHLMVIAPAAEGVGLHVSTTPFRSVAQVPGVGEMIGYADSYAGAVVGFTGWMDREAPAQVFDAIYGYDGEELRVMIAGDVVALPYNGWSMSGFGATISLEWLLNRGNLPGTKARRQLLAELVRTAVADRAGYTITDCRAFRRCAR